MLALMPSSSVLLVCAPIAECIAAMLYSTARRSKWRLGTATGTAEGKPPSESAEVTVEAKMGCHANATGTLRAHASQRHGERWTAIERRRTSAGSLVSAYES